MESIANDMADFGKVTIIDPEKLKDLKTVLTTILALPIARDTFAQVIDGTPTRTPFSDEIKSSRFTFSKTVIVNDNMKPSHKAVQKTDEIKTAFAPQDLMTELKVRRLSILLLYSVQTDMGSWPRGIRMRRRVAENTCYIF